MELISIGAFFKLIGKLNSFSIILSACFYNKFQFLFAY